MTLAKSYIKFADGVVAVYDDNNPASFAAIEDRWIRFLEEGVKEGTKMLLLANKSDL